ncbi:type I methionyl aminopeptidase [Hyphococcus sp.]|uniref:type I methionyl aminopeptidase n=1 Tax=Hyphococcus sp. TaxID=2038636 RepID=UPI00208B7FE2|nr:MAG: methionine aminopeptidase [Marinicaulis sp.]
MTDTLLDEDDLDLRPGAIKLHRAEDFEGMRKAGRVAASCLDMIAEHVQPGVTTLSLDDKIREFVFDHGAIPATIGYRGYRHSSCISLNHVICHGIPGEKILKPGDIMNIDVTVIVDGWHGDTSRMYFAGEPKVKARRLVDATYNSMMAGINAVKPGATLRDIGRAIQTLAEGQGFSVVRDFCGHGLGRVFHDAPNVVHYAEYKDRWGGVHQAADTELKTGMFFTIEPMINEGKPDVKLLKDNWTAVARDKSLSAQFEHSIGVTETGFEIFTASPKGLNQPPY